MTQNLTSVQRAAWVLLSLLAGLQGWIYRHVVSPDGVAYLDLSDAIVTGRLGELVNGYWSPLYPTLVGLLRLAVSWTPLASPYWELALLHAVAFFGFVLALAAFEWFLRALDNAGAHWGDVVRPLATAHGRAAAYLLFGVTMLGMISVAGTVPDFFLAAAMLAAFACALRLGVMPTDRTAATRLGVTLAAGALAKAIAFSLGAVILVALALSIWKRGGGPAVLRAFGVFFVITLPWIIAVSFAVGRPSLGRTGSLNYAWYVNERQPPNIGAPPALATPPESLPISGVVVYPDGRGTDPGWYDPARWHRDLEPTVSLPQQWKRLSWSLRYYAYVAAPLLLAIVVIGASAARQHVILAVRRGAVVLIPCLAALLAYALVYTTSRHIAVFLLATCIALIATLPKDTTVHAGRFAIAFGLTLFAIETLKPPGVSSMVTITFGLAFFLVTWVTLSGERSGIRWFASLLAILLVWALSVLPPSAVRLVPIALALAMWWAVRRAIFLQNSHTGAFAIRRAVATGAVLAFAIPAIAFGVVAMRGASSARGEPHPEWATARRLMDAGVTSGSPIALLGTPGSAGWARLARYRIVGIVPDDQVDAFRNLSDEQRARIMSVFARAGATRLVPSPGR